MQCECLFCYEAAVGRLTTPFVKPRVLLCEEHMGEQMASAARYRKIPGCVVIEPLRS